ncbi:MAG: ATP:cob(I)alamin adenosyltransferase [Proteobacteria bacterium]|nr:ATP:cob(I)alamin adenosyltransferase [Pseudomonadota bacterium]
MVTWRTGSGDRGMTDLLGRRRVSKSDAIIEALGDVDEATSHIGLARAMGWRMGPGRPRTGAA